MELRLIVIQADTHDRSLYNEDLAPIPLDGGLGVSTTTPRFGSR